MVNIDIVPTTLLISEINHWVFKCLSLKLKKVKKKVVQSKMQKTLEWNKSNMN